MHLLFCFFSFLGMAAYHQQLIEDRKTQLEEYKGSSLEEKIITLCGSNCKVNGVFWELIPFYFEKKLNELNIISIHLNTNLTGDKTKISIFQTDIFSTDTIAHITAVFDLINLSVSSDWEPFYFCKEQTSVTQEGKEIIKYTFTSENITINSENLADENIFCIKNY